MIEDMYGELVMEVMVLLFCGDPIPDIPYCWIPGWDTMSIDWETVPMDSCDSLSLPVPMDNCDGCMACRPSTPSIPPRVNCPELIGISIILHYYWLVLHNLVSASVWPTRPLLARLESLDFQFQGPEVSGSVTTLTYFLCQISKLRPSQNGFVGQIHFSVFQPAFCSIS